MHSQGDSANGVCQTIVHDRSDRHRAVIALSALVFQAARPPAQPCGSLSARLGEVHARLSRESDGQLREIEWNLQPAIGPATDAVHANRTRSARRSYEIGARLKFGSPSSLCFLFGNSPLVSAICCSVCLTASATTSRGSPNAAGKPAINDAVDRQKSIAGVHVEPTQAPWLRS